MRIYPDLKITGRSEELAALLAKLDALSDSLLWTRDLRAEEDLKALSSAHEDWRSYRNKKSSDVPQAILWLRIFENEWTVPNIVPLADGQLTPEVYSALLNSFRGQILESIGDLAISVSEPVAEVGPEYWLSKDAAESLHRFSSLANKSTGASHPYDRARWNAFVIASYRDKCDVDGSTLSNILTEHEGWPESKASDLGVLFEYEKSLLDALDEHA